MNVTKKRLSESPAYRASYTAATDYIDQQMCGYAPALEPRDQSHIVEERLLEYQLIASNCCPTKRTAALLQETACRLIPLGRVAAFAKEYSKGLFFVILDSGLLDFFGNLAALGFAVFEQERGLHDYGLNEQALIGFLFPLGMVYFDFGLKTRNEALVFPHFRYGKLQGQTTIHAYNLSAKALAFIQMHEFGHVVSGHGEISVSASDREHSADVFGLVAIKETAKRTGNIAETEMAVIGSIFALRAIAFVETTFPGLEFSRGGNLQRFPELLGDHPSASERLDRLFQTMPPEMRAHFSAHPLMTTIFDTFNKVSNEILAGARPSPGYWELQEAKLAWHTEKARKWDENDSAGLRVHF